MTQPGSLLSPGTSVVQKRKGPTTLPAVATAIGGFLCYCAQGPVGVPIQIVSPDDAAEVFGGRITSPAVGRLTDTLIDFFAEGGTTCYVMRYAGTGAASAARTLYTVGLTYGSMRSAPGSFPVTNFANGDTLYGVVDGGGAGTPFAGGATCHVINGSASITFSGNQSLPKGTPLIFTEQPGVVYFLSAAIVAGTAGTLTSVYTGTTDVTSGGDYYTVLDAVIEATAATIDGSGGTFAAVTAGHTLTVFIAGVLGNQVITFNGTENTENTFKTQINAQLRGASVADDGSGQLRWTTTVLGSSAAGSIVGGSADVLASLGLTPGAFTNAGPNNVANLASVQASEVAAIQNSAFTGSTTVVNNDNSITWQTNTLAGSGSVELANTGAAAAKIAGYTTNTLFAGSNTAPLPTIVAQAAVGKYLSPGSYANLYGISASQQTQFVTSPAPTAAGVTSTLLVSSAARLSTGDQFSITSGQNTQRGTIASINGNTLTLVASITVPGGGYAGTEKLVLETFSLTVYDDQGNIVLPSPFTGLRVSPLSVNYFVTVINNAPRSPIQVTDLAPSISDARPITDTAPINMTGGSDGSAPVAANVTSVVQNWDQAQDVNMVSTPGVATDFPGAPGVGCLVVEQAYVNNRADLMDILDEPSGIPGIGAGGARDWIQNTANLASSYMAVYWPWCGRLDAVTGALAYFPPSPHVQGVVARVNYNVNFATPPAGLENGQLQNVQDLQTIVAENGPEYNDAYPANVNFILKFPGQGFAIWGSRTLDPTGEFGQFNVQYGFNIAKRIIKQGTRFVNFAYNTPSTRQSVVRVLTALFRGWRVAGILQGTSDAEAFYIQCDDKNNTPAVIASRQLVCKIGLAFNEPIEFQYYTLEQDTQAVDQSLSTQVATGSSVGS